LLRKQGPEPPQAFTPAQASTDYSSPAGNGSAHSFNSTHWASGDYYQFQVSTVSLIGINIQWDQTGSGTAPASFELDYGTSPSGPFTLVSAYNVGTTSWSSSSHTNSSSFSFNLPAGANNQSTLFLRLIADANATSTAGTDKVDNVVVQTPEPTTLALLALAALPLIRRR
jgi:hypothetical protein